MIQGNERLNLIVVSSLASTLVILIVGTFAAMFAHLTLPEFVNNVTTLVAGGLLGFLGAHRAQGPTGNQTEVQQADSVVVQAPGEGRP